MYRRLPILTCLASSSVSSPETRGTIQLGIEYDPEPPFDSGHPDRAPATIKSALLSGRYEEARSAFRAGIDKATEL
jgi:cyclohexyl-isocyanide hydratase